jgi:hypothetical protein
MAGRGRPPKPTALKVLEGNPRYTLAHIKDRCPADTIMRFISGFKEPFKKVCHISHHPFSLAAVPFTK